MRISKSLGCQKNTKIEMDNISYDVPITEQAL